MQYFGQVADFLAAGDEWSVAFISGGTVAALQLLVAYLLLDRFIDAIRRRHEQKKWNKSRNELCANLLYFAYVVCRPTVHYSKIVDGRLHPRVNVIASFDHIDHKARDFNALLAIYANSIPQEWYAEIVSSSFELQAAASTARTASRNWQKIEDLFKPEASLAPKQAQFDGAVVKSIVGSDKYEVPADYPDREIIQFVFAHYHTLLSVHHTAEKLRDLVGTILQKRELSELNDTKIFSRLRQISHDRSEPFSSEYFKGQLDTDLIEVAEYIQVMKCGGFDLHPENEFD